MFEYIVFKRYYIWRCFFVVIGQYTRRRIKQSAHPKNSGKVNETPFSAKRFQVPNLCKNYRCKSIPWYISFNLELESLTCHFSPTLVDDIATSTRAH